MEIINKQYFKNCVPFTDCTTETNNTQVVNAKELGLVMSMCNVIRYSDNYLVSFFS